MVRTIGVRSPNAASNVAIEVPAAIDTNSVLPLPKACSAGKAAAIICGLTASKATAGAGGMPWLRCTPVAFSQSVGCGSITQTLVAGTESPSICLECLADAAATGASIVPRG